MPESLFTGRETIPARAMLVGERIDVRALGIGDRLATSPLLVRAGDGRAAAVLRYGVVVFFNLTPAEEGAFLEAIRPYITGALTEPELDSATIAIRPEIDGIVDPTGAIGIAAPSVERLQIVATVLAKSTVLAFYERQLATVFDRIEPMARALQHQGRSGSEAREILREIGDVLLMRHTMVGRVEVAEKPDLLWDHPELERLYARLQDEYELTDRSRALERKLDLISLTAATALELLQNRRTLRVEWYIVILILIEIGLTLYEMFVAKAG